MAFIQAVRPGGWGKFSTPAVINKTNIVGSFNNYGGGFGVGMPMYGGGMMMGGCTMDYGCYGGGGMKPFWGGFLGGFLGGVLNFFGGGGSRVSDSSALYSYQQGPGVPGGGDGLDSLREIYPDHKFSRVGNKFVCVTSDGKQITGKSPEDLLGKLGGGGDGTITGGAGRIGGGDEGGLKGKDQLAEECQIFNGKYAGKGVNLEVITDPNDPNKNEYKLTYKDKDGKEHVETVKTILEAQNKLGEAGIVTTGNDRAAALRELREEATEFNENHKNDGVELSVNDNPEGDQTKGTDLQYTLKYNGQTKEFRTVPTDAEIAQFKQEVDKKGGAGDPTDVQDDGGRGSHPVQGGTNEAFEKIFGKGVLPDGCEPVKDKDGNFTGVKYNGQVYSTPDELMKAMNGFDLVSSDGFDLNSLKDKNFDIIDHGDISDIGNVKATDITGDTIKIGSHTYKVISTNDQGHVYLQATDNPNQTEIYILEKGTDKFRLSQYKYTESGQTKGQGVAGYKGWGVDID